MSPLRPVSLTDYNKLQTGYKKQLPEDSTKLQEQETEQSKLE